MLLFVVVAGCRGLGVRWSLTHQQSKHMVFAEILLECVRYALCVSSGKSFTKQQAPIRFVAIVGMWVPKNNPALVLPWVPGSGVASETVEFYRY